MDTNRYEIIILPTAKREIDRIYEYISKDLYAERAAEKLVKLYIFHICIMVEGII